MKKLLLLLLLCFSASYGQAEFDNISIIGNQTSTTATKANVQESNGVINTVSIASLSGVIEVANAAALPATGQAGKIYVTIDNQLQYRWTGSIYNPYFESKENVANKKNTLSTSSIFYPTNTAVIDGLNLKANKTFLNVKDFGAVGNGVANDKAAIENAVAALPTQGGVIYIPNGVYYSPSGYLISRDNVTVIGENMPRADNSLNFLTGGTILQGGIIIDGNNINVENLGADFGITYSNARRSGSGGDGFVIHKVGLNGIIKNISVKNVIGLVRIGDFNDAQAAFHAVLLEGIQFGSASNVVGIGGWFGIVLKATDFNATGLTARENDAASVYIKSNSYAPVARLNVSNINISNFSARGFIGLLIQSSNAELQNVSANNINVNGGGIAVKVEAEVTEPCVAVSVSNLTARGVDSGISVRGAVYSFVSSNSVIYNPVNSGFQTSQNTSNVNPIDVLVDNLRVMPSATTTISVNVGNVNTKGVFSNINVSTTDGKTLIAGSVINLQPDSNINNYVGLLKRGGALTDSYRFKGGTTTTGLSDILTTVNKRSDFANPLISLVEGYLGTDKPFLQGFNNFNSTATGLEINPFGGDVTFGAKVTAVNLKATSLTGTGIRNSAVNATGDVIVDPVQIKLYVAVLNQSALVAPVPSVITNSLGGVPTWAYVSPGQYTLNLVGGFPLDKTYISNIVGDGTAAGDATIKCFRFSNDQIILNTTFNAAFTNNQLNKASFKIEVYN
jgi:hypothetical protein